MLCHWNLGFEIYHIQLGDRTGLEAPADWRGCVLWRIWLLGFGTFKKLPDFDFFTHCWQQPLPLLL